MDEVWTPLTIAGWQFAMNRDAAYYGFTQSKGCTLQVLYE